MDSTRGHYHYTCQMSSLATSLFILVMVQNREIKIQTKHNRASDWTKVHGTFCCYSCKHTLQSAVIPNEHSRMDHCKVNELYMRCKEISRTLRSVICFWKVPDSLQAW
jgi:hypothetical protein